MLTDCSDTTTCASIHGFTQLPGSQYRATNVDHKAQRNSSTMALDIGQAYPEKRRNCILEAGVEIGQGPRR